MQRYTRHSDCHCALSPALVDGLNWTSRACLVVAIAALGMNGSAHGQRTRASNSAMAPPTSPPPVIHTSQPPRRREIWPASSASPIGPADVTQGAPHRRRPELRAVPQPDGQPIFRRERGLQRIPLNLPHHTHSCAAAPARLPRSRPSPWTACQRAGNSPSTVVDSCSWRPPDQSTARKPGTCVVASRRPPCPNCAWALQMRVCRRLSN